ncbi:fibroblast growth factor 20-like [Anneissia japonica]|uniref:fibroblast growth factor 20-like n=1 Tax=Anneissia japonica TaxID=1529436 RepID=UPI0014259B7B|nr:fibroblast growth factor 20-like [Anneissia japonica]
MHNNIMLLMLIFMNVLIGCQSMNSSSVPAHILPGVVLVSRSGSFIRIGPDGQVNGTLHCNDDYARLEIQAVAPGLVYIKGIQSGLMLAMAGKRNVLARKNILPAILHPDNRDILWREEALLGTCFKTYKSFLEKNDLKRLSRYLALNASGRPAVSTSKYVSRSHFLKMN